MRINLFRIERSIMAQIPCGVLPLRIETGRITGGELQNRLCRNCNINEVEDELHFLFKCNPYK